MDESKELKNHFAHHPISIINNIAFCFKKEVPTKINIKKKQNCLQHIEKHIKNNKAFINTLRVN